MTLWETIEKNRKQGTQPTENRTLWETIEANRNKKKSQPNSVLDNLGNNGTGGTFLGGYKQPVAKEKRVPTAAEIAAQQKEADDAAKYIEYLKALDLDSQQTKIDALKGAVDAAPKYNIRAFGSYDPNNKTVDETTLAKAQEDYNLARSIQYSEKGKEALGSLDLGTQRLIDSVAKYNIKSDSLRSVGVDESAERERNLNALLSKGYTMEEIAQLVDYRVRQINEDEYVKKVQKMEELAASEDFLGISDAGAVAASVASVPLNLGSGLGYLDLLRQKAYFKSAGYDRPLDYNTAAMRLYGQADAARSTVSQRIMDNAETEIGGEVGAFLYQTGMSMADSAVVATLGGLGLGASGTLLLGGSAATAAAVDAKNRGGSDEQALLSGAFAGAAETVFEKVSIDNLLKKGNIKTILGGEFKQLASEIGKQSFVEGSEEVFTEFANFISDQLIMGGSSAYEQSVREYMAQGMTEDEARARAAGDFAIDCATAFIGGAISGGIMGGAVSADRMDTGNNIRNAYAQAYAEDTLRTAPESPVATQVMEKVNEGKKVSGRDIKKLERENQQAVEKARRESAMAEVEELKKPPTARVDNLTLSDGRKVTNYTTDDDGTPVWLTDNGTVRGGEVDNTTVGQANKWGGNIGRVIVEQDDGSEGYANIANNLIESGIASVDGEMSWELIEQSGIADAIGSDRAYALYNAGVSAARSPVFRSYYRAGILGDSFDSVDVNGKWVSNTVKQMAYEMGQFAAKNEKAYTAKQSKNAGFHDNSAAAQKLSKKTRSTLDRIGKTLGVEIRFAVESDHMGEKENGRYDPSTATIIISPNAANPAMVVVAHEVTHRMQELYGKEYKAYRRFVVRAIEKNTGTTAVTALRDRYNNYYREAGRLDSFGDIDAMDELVADYTMAMIENGTLFRDLAQEHRSIAKRLLDALKRVIDRLTGQEQYTLYGTTATELREAQRLWERMLEGEGNVWDAVVGTKKAAEDGGVRHSLVDTKVAEAVHDAMDHRDGGHDNLIKIGQIPSAIADISGITGDLYIYRNHAYENIVSRKQAEEDGHSTSGEHFHALGEEKMIDALVAINEPYLAIAQTSRQGTPAMYLVLPQFAEDGVPLSAAIDFYVDTPINGRHGVRPHVTVTIYARPFDSYIDDFNKPHAGLVEMINDAIKNKKVLLIDKKIRADVPVTAKRTSLGSVTTSALEKNVAQFKREVKAFKEKNKIRYSLTTDSKGNNLSEAQVEFFENSTVRDKKGRLIPVYHGTTNDFNVFKRGDIGFHFGTKGAARGRVGYGKNVKIKEVYLNITNPIEFDVDFGSWDADYRLTEELYDRGILSREEAMSVLRTDDGKNKRNTGAANKMLVGLLKDKGYDGIVYQNYFETNKPTTSYIAFDSNQAKEITNLNPTEDADIRYSLKADSEGNALTEEQAAYFAESKSVDAQGNLRVMYRGGGDFTVFDRKKSSYANLYGRGFYFTDSKSHAEQYGGARAFYLNITNPVPTDETTITKEQLLAFLRAVAENEDDYSFENYGYGATPESVVDAIYSGKSDFAMLYDVSQSAIGDMVEAVELFNEINGTDFDGLILDTETVTFRSEQAKLTSNKTPTDDPDIRFSLVTEEQARENNKTALEYFGRTYKWSETGYILLDGSRLDFSGKHEGAPGGYRTVDHRDIRDAFGDDYGGNGYSDSLVQFMREGNIRIMPESGGINLSVAPTKEQERSLDDFISKERGEVVLDLDDDRGNTVASVEYPRGTRASKVLADIRKYFEDGTMPQVSELAQFRYSLKSDAAMGRTLRDMAEAQNATEKAVKAWVADVHRGKKVDVNIDEAERVAQNLISDYRSSADRFEVTGAVLDLFNYLQNGDGNKNMDTDTIKEKANTVADILLSAEMRGRYYAADFVETPNGMELSDAAQDNEELRKFLRGTKIVFPKEYVSDLGEENWTAFKEGLKGAQARLSDENNRANVDTLYREDLSRMWPQYFPDSVTGEAAMMQRIAEVSQRVFARTNRAHSEGEIEAMMQMTASDILDRFFNLPQVGKTYISVRNLREKSTRTVRRLQDQLQVRDSQGSRASIIRKVKALDKKLRDNTEKSHVPDYLRSAVLELCSLFTQNTSVFSMNQLAKIKLQYDYLAKDKSLQMVYDEEISEILGELAQTVNGRRLSELTGEELRWVNDVVSHFTHLVNNANQAFLDDKRVAVEGMANRVISKAITDGKNKSLPIPALFASGNIKPYYFFKNIGGQMQELFADLLNGQSRYGRLMNEADAFRKEIYQKYNADKWINSEEKLEMNTARGDKIVLSVGEAMSILATYKREVTNREQDAGHLSLGGIVYEDEMQREIDSNKKLSVKALINKVLQKPDAKAKPISAADVMEIGRWLRQNVSENAESFVDEMVGYLSTEMADYGNETSMKLTGIRKYNERYYFPYKVSSVYLASKLRDPKESPALRRPGFSKGTQYKANNPIVLRNFMDVWSEHVSEMLTYATMAVPQDTLLRVLNYNDVTVDVEDGTNVYKTVKEAIQNAYGKNAVEYIETLLRDMNGGVAIDEREKALSTLVRIYKKNAVGLSLSVAIQQPTSAVRAMAEIDPKYFFGVSMKGDYEQLKKYSGVAVIKEMGGFDTNLGRGGATWLKGEDSFIEKAIGFMPQKMDQATWAYLWNVVKAETRDKHPDLLDNGKETEAFLYAAGRRFDEVVEKTQVYDSVLSRSQNMRVKGGLFNLFLSFMSEPMVTLNMAVDAVRSKDAKRITRVGAALMVSIVFNNIVKALWTAGRDDEEEKTYLEKLLYRFNNYMSSDIIPLNYIPILKDIDDIWKGYGTSIDLLEPLTDFFEKGQKAAEKTQDFGVQGVFSEETMDFLLAIPSLFGVPLDNVKRDVETLINLATKMAPIDEATKRDLLNAFREGWGADASLKETLRNGWRNKDNERKRKNALADIEAAYQDKVRGYQKKGKTLKEAQQAAKSSIQSSCTNYLKPIYQSLTGAKKNEVKQFALRISVGGKQLYADYDFSKWDE